MDDAACSQTVVRAAIQQRCAEAFLHDIRGSLQAVFGALELLCRVAKGGAEDSGRAEKACGLARRAISHHEKSTLDLVQLLTFHTGGVRALDLRALVDELVHLFRNDIATRELSIEVSGEARPSVLADRSELHAAVAALLTWAIDWSSPGTQLGVQIESEEGCGILTLQTMPGSPGHQPPPSMQPPAPDAPPSHATLSEELLLEAVRQFASERGGRLEFEPREDPRHRRLRLSLPGV